MIISVTDFAGSLPLAALLLLGSLPRLPRLLKHMHALPKLGRLWHSSCRRHRAIDAMLFTLLISRIHPVAPWVRDAYLQAQKS
jgi:hypothetical protein